MIVMNKIILIIHIDNLIINKIKNNIIGDILIGVKGKIKVMMKLIIFIVSNPPNIKKKIAIIDTLIIHKISKTIFYYT